MLTTATDLRPGFGDYVMDAQATFRAILHAMSYPGRVMEAGAALEPPPPLHRATAAIGLSLFDLDTPVWLDDAAETPEVKAFFQFHCGCPFVASPGDARFAVIADASRMPALADFDSGTDEAPDRSATVLVQAERFLQGSGGVALTGPGIEERVSILVDGLAREFWEQRRAQQHLFPRGLDLVFAADYRLIGLPRTTRLEL